METDYKTRLRESKAEYEREREAERRSLENTKARADEEAVEAGRMWAQNSASYAELQHIATKSVIEGAVERRGVWGSHSFLPFQRGVRQILDEIDQPEPLSGDF